MPAAGDSYCYWKADKWVLCHADSPKAAEGGYVGLIGKNLDITVDWRIAPNHHKGACPLCGGLRRADIGKCRTGEAAGRLAVCGFWDMWPAFLSLPVGTLKALWVPAHDIQPCGRPIRARSGIPGRQALRHAAIPGWHNTSGVPSPRLRYRRRYHRTVPHAFGGLAGAVRLRTQTF